CHPFSCRLPPWRRRSSPMAALPASSAGCASGRWPSRTTGRAIRSRPRKGGASWWWRPPWRVGAVGGGGGGGGRPRGGPLLGAGAPYAAVVAAAALALMVLGFIDDMRGLSVQVRLIGQIAAVTAAVLLMPADLRVLPDIFPLAVERVGLIAAALWFVNLFNF